MLGRGPIASTPVCGGSGLTGTPQPFPTATFPPYKTTVTIVPSKT